MKKKKYRENSEQKREYEKKQICRQSPTKKKIWKKQIWGESSTKKKIWKKQIWELIRQDPYFICTVCHQCLYKCSVRLFEHEKYHILNAELYCPVRSFDE